MYFKKPSVQDISSWSLPGSAELRNGELGPNVWWNYADRKFTSDARAALEEFLGLANKPAVVLPFVKRWGPLITELAVMHHDGWQEPADIYETLSAAFGAALSINACLGRHEKVPADLWRNLYRWPHLEVPGLGLTTVDKPFWTRTTANDSYFLLAQINAWLDSARVTPALVKKDTALFGSIQFNVRSLFGALAVQLMKEIAQVPAAALCSNPKCRKSFAPLKRRPKFGQRSFCPGCRKAGVPRNMALRDFRERERQVKTVGETVGRKGNKPR